MITQTRVRVPQQKQGWKIICVLTATQDELVLDASRIDLPAFNCLKRLSPSSWVAEAIPSPPEFRMITCNEIIPMHCSARRRQTTGQLKSVVLRVTAAHEICGENIGLRASKYILR